ncbi:DUF6573 family protein [Dyella sp. GSA-30]|uniref:DUF6573 family protein n=1 Tax=Dyella sp. GSA-30 TaxID=2994496 RepID=UPI0024911427|nr:DUF6573 family protein [Dyella sp. GSA-30]BDU18598.1 hypothetical protein DYGSA30_00550 [Dyella sp. GSA-30]
MSDHDALFTNADLIYAYTRSDALMDGVLIALPNAESWGFKVPVAITASAYAECIAWNAPDPKLESILRVREDMVLLAAINEAKAHRKRQLKGSVERPDRVDFEVETVVLPDGIADVCKVNLYMVIGPGDAGEPVGTIMLIGED